MSAAPDTTLPAAPPDNADACDVFEAHPASVSQLRRLLLGASAVSALADTFKLLGDGTRVRILDALSKSELCVCDLATLLTLSESAVSHQLRLLRGMRLVRSRRAGRMVFYALDDQHILRLFEQGLEHVEEAQERREARGERREGRAEERGEAGDARQEARGEREPAARGRGAGHGRE